MAGSKHKKELSVGGIVVVVLVAIASYLLKGDGQAGNGTPVTGVQASDGAGAVLEAYRSRSEGLMLEFAARVRKTLPDDNDGSRHQRFLVDVGGHSLLIAHNIDLAQRVPLAEGDEVRIFGQFEWNEQGGVVHWTHHDPGRRREGGWILHQGNRYE